MSFLTPFFLLGALAVAAPILFHLIRQTSKEQTEFSSLMFLLPVPPRVTRRSRIEHILLLVLRSLVVCLLAFAFARPFLPKADSADLATGPGKRIVVLVDTSASMRREGLWAAARAKAETILRSATPEDTVAVFAFDREVRRLITFEQWASAPAGQRATLAIAALTKSPPGWQGTQLGQALINAASALDDVRTQSGQTITRGPRQIVLISDLQEGSRLDALQAFEWPKDTELVVDPVKAKLPTNAGLQLLADTDDNERQPGEALARVRVSNSTDAKREQFQVGWSDGKEFVGKPQDVYVPPGQTRVVALSSPPLGSNPERVLLRGDDDPFDNTLALIPPEAARVSVLYLGGEVPSNTAEPLYFLQRAFPSTRRQIVQILALTPAASLQPADVAAPLIIVTDALPEERIASIRQLLTGGKTVLVSLKNKGVGRTLAGLLGRDSLTADEMKVPSYAMLAEIDFQHPLFAPFADPRFSDFTKIHFWKYRQLDPAQFPGARVVAKFDTGDPALLQVPVGQGTLYVLASGWQPSDSQLALSSKFLPLLFSLLDQAGGIRPQVTQHTVGDSVPLAATNAAVQVTRPDGTSLTLGAGTAAVIQTDQPGIYTAVSGVVTQRFAVNLDPLESKTAPLPIEELEHLGLPVKRAEAKTAAQAAEAKRQLANAELEGRQKLWRWVIAFALVFVTMETLLAGWLAKRPLGGATAT
ncbi:MAG: VWA domain-containing protein [Proteobacteria bacterium]|nr:VWA domain-containing protein [Pseudomonadota bacterium]